MWAGGRVYSAQALPAPPGDYTFHGGPHPVPPYGSHTPPIPPTPHTSIGYILIKMVEFHTGDRGGGGQGEGMGVGYGGI